MCGPLGTVQLRNTRRVYDDEGGYRVVQEGRKGEEHGWTVPSALVEFLTRHFSGKTVTSKEAAHVVEPSAGALRLPWTYGYKLGYFVQDALVVLVVLGKATLRKVGRRYEYTVRAAAR